VRGRGERKKGEKLGILRPRFNMHQKKKGGRSLEEKGKGGVTTRTLGSKKHQRSSEMVRGGKGVDPAFKGQRRRSGARKGTD